ncbi:MAG: VCBS repeat-containing protein [Planctomycetota bacterium]
MTKLVVLAAVAGSVIAPFEAHARSDQKMTDASADLLPLAVTNGKTMDMEAADLDGDGFADLVIAVEFGQNAVLMWRDGRYVHAVDALPQGIRRDSEDIAIADFDGDGDLDIAIAVEDDVTNELYLNDGGGVFTDATSRLPVTGTSNAVIAIDADLDGDQDLIFGNKGVNFLLRNDGNAGFSYDPEALPQQNDATQDLEAGDIDGDGDLDLVVGNENNNRVLINDGSGNFTDNTDAAIGARTAEETREADLGDIDGDGDLDIVFANVGWAQFPPGDKILINDGTGVFADESVSRIPFINEFSLDADLADIDNDGDLDIITARIAGGLDRPATVFINDGEGRFTDESSTYIPESVKGIAIDVELLDLNHDGTIDLYIGCHLPCDYVLLG